MTTDRSPTATSRTVLSAEDRLVINRQFAARVRFDEPMSRHTTLKIGGPADAWVAPESVDEMVTLLAYCASRKIPVVSVGGGSNLLVRDGGVRGVVLATRNLRQLVRCGALEVDVQAGVSTGKLLAATTAWELGGVEFLGGVPGSVGGGLVMNAGTYLGEFTQVTREVSSVRLADGGRVTRDHAACGFVYRGSALPPTEVVVGARISLKPRPREEIEVAVRELRDRREAREPHKVSNAGSVFKNPPGDFAGRLIESVGMKGTKVGEAECSPVHANWFVNPGGATAADMFGLIAMAREKVAAATGVELALEWKLIGEDC